MGILSKLFETLFPPTETLNIGEQKDVFDKKNDETLYEEGYYTLKLQNSGNKKIQVIKTIREVTGFGLKEAKDIADTTPATIKTNLNKSTALKYKEELESFGATVTMIDNSDYNRSANEQLD